MQFGLEPIAEFALIALIDTERNAASLSEFSKYELGLISRLIYSREFAQINGISYRELYQPVAFRKKDGIERHGFQLRLLNVDLSGQLRG